MQKLRVITEHQAALEYLAGATQEQIVSAAKSLGITAEQLLKLTGDVDPTPEHKFEAWLIKQLKFKNIRLPEDGGRVKKVLY